MARATTRRTKTSHPGVKLRKREWKGEDGAVTSITWFARYVEPDSGREVDFNLTKKGLTTDAARVDWARRMSRKLRQRAADLAAGAPRESGTSLRHAVAAYLGDTDALPTPLPPVLADLASGATDKRESTLASAKPGLDRLLSWAGARGIESTDDLDEAAVGRFREWLVAARRRDPAKGEKRGKHAESERRLSPVSINAYLKATKALLNKLLDVGLLPKITDERRIKRALKRVREDKHEPEILRAPEVRALVLACLKHDAAAYVNRRADVAERDGGSLARYHAITPFVAFLLLTGCRLTEALSLTWGNVDLDALDDQGRPVGRLRVTADVSKTHEARGVDLDVCPVLRRLLRALHVRAADRRGLVFADITAPVAKAALRRLTLPELPPADTRAKRSRRERTPAPRFGAPAFGWHTLRRTCGTFLVCAPSIYGAAAVWLAAKRLGHSVEVAEKHYLNVVRGIDPAHRTLEAALGVADLLDALASRLAGESVEAAGVVSA